MTPPEGCLLMHATREELWGMVLHEMDVPYAVGLRVSSDPVDG